MVWNLQVQLGIKPNQMALEHKIHLDELLLLLERETQYETKTRVLFNIGSSKYANNTHCQYMTR